LFVRRGGQREWCSAECGNRARVLRHYQRHSRRAGSSHSATR
jgi:predicted RNA-binding Zn ribbon-like protein